MAGSGDVKDKDRLLDELIRQQSLDSDAKKRYPRMHNLLAGRVEDTYRAAPASSLVGRDAKAVPYDSVYNWADTFLRENNPNYDQLDPDDRVLALRTVAENMSSEAFNQDILKPKDFLDQLTKLKSMEGADKNLKVEVAPKNDPELANNFGYYSPELNKLVIGTKGDEGTAMHEMGHARMKDVESKAEEPSNAYRAIAARKGIPIRDFSPTPDVDISDDEKRSLLQSALGSGDAYTLAEGLSKGHYGPNTYVNYPLDRGLEVFGDKLKQEGFEKERPEKNPRFQSLRSIMGLTRSLNK